MDPMRAARHASATHAVSYKRDSKALLALDMFGTRRLPKWLPIRVDNVEMGRVANMGGLTDIRDLATHADNFVTNILGVGDSHPCRTVSFVYQQACQLQKGTTNLEKITSLAAALGKEQLEMLLDLIDAYAVERRYNAPVVAETVPAPLATATSTQLLPTTSDVVAVISSSANMTTGASSTAIQIPDVPAPKRRGGNIVIVERKSRMARAITAKQRLEVIVEMGNELAVLPRDELVDADCQFAIRQVDPVIRCLTKHFKENHELFLEKYPDFRVSRFVQLCNGIDDFNCGTDKKNIRSHR